MKKPSQYNITDIAQELGVTRQTVYYWIKKSWVTPKRDYRNYPVFTKEDLNHIRKWQNTLLVNTPAPSAKKGSAKPQPTLKWRDFQSLLCK
jgi:transposase-like protein